MTEKQVEKDLQSLGNYLKAYDPRAESIYYAYVRLIIHLYEERAAQRKQTEPAPQEVLYTSDMIPEDCTALYEVVDGASTSLQPGDKGRIVYYCNKGNGAYFLKEGETVFTGAGRATFRKIESPEAKSIE